MFLSYSVIEQKTVAREKDSRVSDATESVSGASLSRNLTDCVSEPGPIHKNQTDVLLAQFHISSPSVHCRKTYVHSLLCNSACPDGAQISHSTLCAFLKAWRNDCVLCRHVIGVASLLMNSHETRLRLDR